MTSLSKKQVNVIVAVAAVVIFGLWELVIVPSNQKGDVYEGTIVETYKKRKWWRLMDDPMDTARYRNFYYFWRVETADGEEISAEVPWFKWKKGESGDPVKKIKGERWPVINTEEAAAARKDKHKALDMIFGD